MIKKNKDKEWYKQFRTLWDRSPVSRIKESDKRYKRDKEKQNVRRTSDG